MKKRTIKRILGVGIVFLFVFLCSCKSSSSKEPLSSANDFYGLGAVTTVNLLQSNETALKTKNLSTTEDIHPILNKFNTYFSSLDYFSGEELIQTTVEKNTDSDYPYESKMIISGKDMNGIASEHILYYTETLIKEKKDDDETKKIYELSGIMVENEINYYLLGNREIEQEEDEHENELNIRAYRDLNDRLNYVEMEQEISLEANETEKEYTYRVYTDGHMVEETSVEFETERKNNQDQLEYEIEFMNGTGKGKYSVESKMVDGVAQIKVKYNIMGTKGSFHIQKNRSENQQIYDYILPDDSHILFEA